MSRLLSLPIELVEHIIAQNISPVYETDTLYQLSLTCKPLSRIASNLLWASPFRPFPVPVIEWLPRVRSLVQTLVTCTDTKREYWNDYLYAIREIDVWVLLKRLGDMGEPDVRFEVVQGIKKIVKASLCTGQLRRLEWIPSIIEDPPKGARFDNLSELTILFPNNFPKDQLADFLQIVSETGTPNLEIFRLRNFYHGNSFWALNRESHEDLAGRMDGKVLAQLLKTIRKGRLRVVDVSFRQVNIDDDDSFWEALASQCERLVEFSLYGPPNSVKPLPLRLLKMPSLELVDWLCISTTADDMLEFFKNVGQIKILRLEEVDASGAKNDHRWFKEALSKGDGGLLELTFQETNWNAGSATAKELALIPSLAPNIHILDLQHCAVAANTLQAILAGCHKLQCLKLGDPHLSLEGVPEHLIDDSHLMALKLYGDSLQQLELYGGDFTEAGLRSFATGSPNNLQTLIISNSMGINDMSLPYFIFGLPNLNRFETPRMREPVELDILRYLERAKPRQLEWDYSFDAGPVQGVAEDAQDFIEGILGMVAGMAIGQDMGSNGTISDGELSATGSDGMLHTEVSEATTDETI